MENATVMRISTRCGSPCGKVNLNLLHEKIVLGDGYALSLRETIFSVRNDLEGILELGKARGKIGRPTGAGFDGCRAYGIAIESTSIPDFIALYREVLRRSGQRFEHIAPSFPMTPPNEQSFVRGLGNDLRRLKQYIAAQASNARRRFGFKIFSH
jgi:hypothetical protein